VREVGCAGDRDDERRRQLGARHRDGGAIPPKLVATAVAEIVRVTGLPVSADLEDGYSAEPERVAEVVSAVIDAGAVGINLEDGKAPPDQLVAKIGALRRAASRLGVDLFVNARTDVYLARLVPAERALDETIERGRRYREAGCDGLFVPAVSEPGAIRAIAAAVDLPLNVLARPGLAAVAELRAWGVRRVSAGAGVCRAALGAAQRAIEQLLAEGRYDAMFEAAIAAPDMNGLFAAGSGTPAQR
jgi:2-methylisocitrate lyase-like PEP mutase family enzyme